MEMPPKQWTILNPVIEDAESLSRMHAQSWRDTYTDIQPGVDAEWVESRVAEKKESPEAIERYRSHIEDANLHPDNWLYRIAKGPDGEVVGFVLAKKDDETQHVGAFYIGKEYQGSGLAQELAGELTSWFDAERDVSLEVALNNSRAISFYRKLGFEVVPGSEHSDDGLDEVNMIKPGVKDEV